MNQENQNPKERVTVAMEHGDWCASDDVRKLEQSNAELLEIARVLLEVAHSVVEEYECDDGADWQSIWNLARKAISKSKGVL